MKRVSKHYNRSTPAVGDQLGFSYMFMVRGLDGVATQTGRSAASQTREKDKYEWKCVETFITEMWGHNEMILHGMNNFITPHHQLRAGESQHLGAEWRASRHLPASRWETICQRAGWSPPPPPSPCTLPKLLPAASPVQLPQSVVRPVFPQQMARTRYPRGDRLQQCLWFSSDSRAAPLDGLTIKNQVVIVKWNFNW